MFSGRSYGELRRDAKPEQSISLFSNLEPNGAVVEIVKCEEAPGPSQQQNGKLRSAALWFLNV